jgi:hypothetical protein
VGKQSIEQLERIVEAEASRAGAPGDDALQLQALVGGGAHAVRHDDGAPRLSYGTGDERQGPAPLQSPDRSGKQSSSSPHEVAGGGRPVPWSV